MSGPLTPPRASSAYELKRLAGDGDTKRLREERNKTLNKTMSYQSVLPPVQSRGREKKGGERTSAANAAGVAVQRYAPEPRGSLAFQPRFRTRRTFDRVELAERPVCCEPCSEWISLFTGKKQGISLNLAHKAMIEPKKHANFQGTIGEFPRRRNRELNFSNRESSTRNQGIPMTYQGPRIRYDSAMFVIRHGVLAPIGAAND